MTITLTPDQEKAIREAIKAGFKQQQIAQNLLIAI